MLTCCLSQKSSIRLMGFCAFVFFQSILGITDAQEVDFNRQIRPILSQHCIACHGPDEGHREAGFRIDVAEEAHSAIALGDPANSEVFERITSDDDDFRMPPAGHSKALKPEQVELIRKWIDEGANYATHWSFVAPKKSSLPTHRSNSWARNEIDAFVAHKLEKTGLKPLPAAAPSKLIRRVALDLTGLPPTLEMVQRYKDAPTDETYEQIVDELLASKRYGEHWTAMWLDIARYADTIGYAEDKHRDIWPWRDWVIRSFNENKPFDEFTIEQLAGDLLSEPTEDQKLATAFHRNTLNNTEGGTSNEEFRTIAVKDRLSTTLNVWMGLTVRCAECHSHKYDPISQTEYYQLLDFFNHTSDADENHERPKLPLFPAGREAQLSKLDSQINDTKAKLIKAAFPTPEFPATRDLVKRVKNLEKQRSEPVQVPVLEELPDARKRATHIMIRGSYLQKGEPVSAAIPKAFPGLPKDATANRLGVAHWIVNKDNPLTARVTVNRFWARIFGIGIVETEEDFGTQGTYPSHPELLDWLAVDFQEHGWDVKRLLKQIVMSATYRQSGTADAKRLELDPRNVYLSRGPRFRMRAEVIRDQALAVSGLLGDKMFGPPVYPPNPVKRVVSAFTGGTNWVDSEGEDRYRRAIYTYLKRSAPHPLFETFDMATREVCNMRRIRTNTPLQSFMTLNDQSFIEAAQALALKMHSAEGDIRKKIAQGFILAMFDSPSEKQTSSLEKLYEAVLKDYESAPDEAKAMIESMSRFNANAETMKENQSELASLTVVANVILNLDAFLIK